MTTEQLVERFQGCSQLEGIPLEQLTWIELHGCRQRFGEVLSNIFDPFSTTKPVGRGAGLGLDIARRLIRGHDGEIGVESRSGRTEFRVAIPIVDGALAGGAA